MTKLVLANVRAGLNQGFLLIDWLLAVAVFTGLGGTARADEEKKPEEKKSPPYKTAPQTKNSSRSTRPGKWSQMTTFTLRGKQLDIRQYQQLVNTEQPDDVLRCFPREAALSLTSVGLDVGFDVILEAKSKPKQKIAIPLKDAEVSFEVVTKKDWNGRIIYQPSFVFNVKKARPAMPSMPGMQGHGMHGLPLMP